MNCHKITSYVFIEGDVTFIVGIDPFVVPIKLFFGDVLNRDAKVFSQQTSEFVGLEGGVAVFVVGLEDGSEALEDDIVDI